MRNDLDKIPKEIIEHGFDFHWDNQKVWLLDIPTEEIDITEIDWVLDLPFWKNNNVKYTLSPRKVLENIDLYPEHKERILKANTFYPIDVMKNYKNQWTILDGVHRLARLLLERNTKVKVRKIPRDLIFKIEKH